MVILASKTPSLPGDAQGICSFCKTLAFYTPSMIPPGTVAQGICCLECFKVALGQGLVSKIIFPTKAFKEFAESVKTN